MNTHGHERPDVLPVVGARPSTRPSVGVGLRAEQLRADLLGTYLEAMALWCELCSAHALRPESYAGSHAPSHGRVRVADSPGPVEFSQPTEHNSRT